jgi:DNA invertase Pin-like site-specific DNA recombinase
MPTPPRRLAVSYTRYSDPSQAEGDSESRQADMFRDFCTHHNLTPLAERFADRGLSGYKDEHRRKGRLGQLIAMARDGRFEPGTVIVVEAWDRLGRLRPDEMTRLVSDLVRTGVGIGVCRLNSVFTDDDFGSDKWYTLSAFISLAYNESKQKSDRIARAWSKRRETVADKKLPGRVPAWVERVGKEGFRLIPDRAAAVKRIFALAAAGLGYSRIVRELVGAGVEPFGDADARPGRSRSAYSGAWSRAYVGRILGDARAMGTFQPHKVVNGKREPAGPPLENYYPAVVTAEEFHLAQAGRLTRHQPRGERQQKYVNVFKGLLRHARDGRGMVLRNRRSGARPQLVLVNATGHGSGGTVYTFPYPVFEQAVLGRLAELDPKDVLPGAKEGPSRVDVLRAELANVRADVAALQRDLKGGYSKAVADVLREREQEEQRVAGELQDELARSVRPAERAWKEMKPLLDLVRAGDEGTRLRVGVALRRLVDDARVLIVRKGSWGLCAVQFHFTGGATRSYLIVHQAAAFGRPGGWSVHSFADAALPAEAFDLRRPAHAAKLARLLETVSPEDLAG